MATCVENLLSTVASGEAFPATQTQSQLDRTSVPMLLAIQGVPKAVLRSVFGEALGTRMWLDARNLANRRSPKAPVTELSSRALERRVCDVEVTRGMVEYLCKQAAAALEATGKQARKMSLSIIYLDGSAMRYPIRLAEPSHEAAEMRIRAMSALDAVSIRHMDIEAINLTVTDVEARNPGVSAVNTGTPQKERALLGARGPAKVSEHIPSWILRWLDKVRAMVPARHEVEQG